METNAIYTEKCYIDEDDGDKCKSNAHLLQKLYALCDLCALSTLYSLTKRGFLIAIAKWGTRKKEKIREKCDACNVVLFIKIG